jgi:hypothetical protein
MPYANKPPTRDEQEPPMTNLATHQRYPRHGTWADADDQRARLAPDQAQAAGELVRVSRRSGRIGLASATRESCVGVPLVGSSFGTVVAFG